uniref:Uncharacterized protein n=1 Tax=Arundo donax TaxID=35708 RepID=A0A0A8ZMP7_ARUDO
MTAQLCHTNTIAKVQYQFREFILNKYSSPSQQNTVFYGTTKI